MAMSIWQYLGLGSSRLNQRMGCFWRKGRRALDWRIVKGWMLTIVAVKRGDNGNALLERQSTTCSTHHMNQT